MATRTEYDPAAALLVTRVSGVLAAHEVAEWERELFDAVRVVPPGSAFDALIDLTGYEVSEQDPAVHRVMRDIVPRFLALHGFVVGFWSLYEVEPPAPSARSRCRAVAHVHHDAEKMARYNELLATVTERFFVAADEAAGWLYRGRRATLPEA